MLVNWWGILHWALPAAFGLKKTTALVMALYWLYNYCIDCRERSKEPTPLYADLTEIEAYGGIPL
jgi:hypothetical protein